MSADAVLWIVMAFCLIVGCPIFVSLGVASTLALILTNIPMRIVALDMLKVMDMFPLLAVVGFIFAGHPLFCRHDAGIWAPHGELYALCQRDEQCLGGVCQRYSGHQGVQPIRSFLWKVC